MFRPPLKLFDANSKQFDYFIYMYVCLIVRVNGFMRADPMESTFFDTEQCSRKYGFTLILHVS